MDISPFNKIRKASFDIQSGKELIRAVNNIINKITVINKKKVRDVNLRITHFLTTTIQTKSPHFVFFLY